MVIYFAIGAALVLNVLVVPALEAAAGESATGSGAVDAILDRLESAGRDVVTVRCKVAYTVQDRLNVSDVTRHGSILFKNAEPHPMFLVAFDEIVADGVVHGDKEWWLLRDRWLWEIHAKSKTIIKREILRPGQGIDLFDLSESPIPIPFGQRKDEILAQFDVSLVPPQLGDPDECDHLVCRPKEGVPLAGEIQRLDYYVSRAVDLPVRIVAEDSRGAKVTLAHFRDVDRDHINVKLSDKDFAIPSESAGFHIAVEPLPADGPSEAP